jgi:hypothetical protein
VARGSGRARALAQGDMLTVPDASTGVLNSLNVWLSGITYKGV